MTTLYDSTDPTQIPKDAPMVAGYVGGRWTTWGQLAQLFPDAVRISIAIDSSEDADVLDVEQGDAVPSDVPAWVERQRARGADPTVYCSRVSMWPAVQAAVGAVGIAPPHYWVADYTGVAHLVPGSAATQWTDAGLYDISETDGVWHQPIAVLPPSPPADTDHMEALMTLAASKQDALNAQIRDWWATYRSDPLTPAAVQYLTAGYDGPWAGSIDAVLACIIDTATTQGHLRPQFAGAA